MNLHALTAYIKYRWKARDLHGVHSPFVYELNEKVLRGAGKSAQRAESGERTKNPGLTAKYDALVHRLMSHYGYQTIMTLPRDDEEDPMLQQDVLLLGNAKPGEWISLFNRHLPLLKNTSMVAVAGIHETKRHSAKWERLCKHPKVRVSIDLYGMGLLFFRQEVKEKQHFVLKY